MPREAKRAVQVHVLQEPDDDGKGSVVAANFRWQQTEHEKVVTQAVESFQSLTDQIRAAQRELVELKDLRCEMVSVLAGLVDPTTGDPLTKNEISSLLGLSRQRVDQILQQVKRPLL